MDVRSEMLEIQLQACGSKMEDDLGCFVATSRHSLSVAFRMTYSTYLRNGFVQPNRWGLRILPQQLLDTSWVLLAARELRPIGTLTLIEDGAQGLPIESLYSSEMRALQRQAECVAELTCLATDSTAGTQNTAVLRHLLRSAIALADQRGIDCLTICVHPRHAQFYRRRLGFREFGPLRRCPWVCNQSAVAMNLWLRMPGDATDQQAVPTGHPPIRVPNATSAASIAERAYFYQFLDEVSPLPSSNRRAAAA
jgi:hypothetical protein